MDDGADSLWDRPRQPPVAGLQPSVVASGAGRHRGAPAAGPDVEPVPSAEPPATGRHRDSHGAHRRAARPAGEGLGRVRGRVGLRRALLLIGMTLVLPGSAQLFAGSKAIGRAAMRVLILLVSAAGVIWWRLGRDGVVAWSLHPGVLSVVEAGLIVLGVCWAGLLVDAWRLGRPHRMRAGSRLLSGALVLGLLAGIGAPFGYAVQLAAAQRDFVTSIFEPGPVAQTYQGRLNIAILGGDGGLDRSGIRTDQDAVVSIDIHTGRALLVSIPRNMQYAQFPPGTAMAEKFPNGFPQFFYGIYTYGSQHPELFPGVDNPGAAATESAMAQMLGIPIQYYVTLNLQGFESLIDSLGGLTIRVTQRLPIGGGHQTGACDLPGGGCREGKPNPILGWIEPGLDHLDGYQALWYARSRSSTTDYDRMSRERCVLNGILKQMDPLTVLRHYKALVSSAKNVVRTNLTQGALDVLVRVAATTRKSDVTDLQLQPPLITPAFPDVQPIRDLVQEAIATSNAAAPVPAGPTVPGKSKNKKPKSAASVPTGPGDTVNLDQVCQYS
ncbi:MAG TPA: LCP family protein [Sporichthyaceae bacterium]|jgi:anionic cell wall polymer biosynthesis LytR-Cps2A-Psr (LCP) family protein|nr:LCP family protein [Sporichthyaceae bacterium]